MIIERYRERSLRNENKTSYTTSKTENKKLSKKRVKKELPYSS